MTIAQIAPTRTAEYLIIDTMGLPGTHRCVRCAAQAYVEVVLPSKAEMAFCAHHFTEHESALLLQAVKVIDHRPFLALQEKRFKGVI